jgi:hypothetical protein
MRRKEATLLDDDEYLENERCLLTSKIPGTSPRLVMSTRTALSKRLDTKGRERGHHKLSEVLCEREEDKKLTVAEEGRAAPSNSEMMVSLSGMSGRVFTNCSKLVMVLVICIWRS